LRRFGCPITPGLRVGLLTMLFSCSSRIPKKPFTRPNSRSPVLARFAPFLHCTGPASVKNICFWRKANAKTIINYSGLVKLVVASAESKEGEPLFPRRWDSEFIDLPIVRNQRQPKFTTETMSAIVQNATGQYRVLYALLAGSGLRIGEALGLEVGKHISNDCRTLYVRQSVWEGETQEPKTASAVRDVDLCPALAAVLSAFIGGRTTGFLFQNSAGKPLAQSNVLRRNLHPVLKALGVPKSGFHSFRRFRATHLSESRVPESLRKFWMGLSETNQTEEYVKLFDEVVYRQEVAVSTGPGFEVSSERVSIVRNVRKKSVRVEVGVAA
jgi:integrase